MQLALDLLACHLFHKARWLQDLLRMAAIGERSAAKSGSFTLYIVYQLRTASAHESTKMLLSFLRTMESLLCTAGATGLAPRYYPRDLT